MLTHTFLAVSAGETRGFIELLLLLVGTLKWPALAVTLGAAYIAYNQNEEGNENAAFAAAMVACAAGGWFLAGLILG